MKVDELGAKCPPPAAPIDQMVVPHVGLPAASVQVKTPEVDVRTAPCLLWTQAFITIRWSDNRLSGVSFEMPVGYFNLDAHC